MSSVKSNRLSWFEGWQPLTFRGVASFAKLSFSRLFVLMLLVSLACTLIVGNFLHGTFVREFERGIEKLPLSGASIRNARLTWPSPHPARIMDSRFVTLVVEPNQEQELGNRGDLHLELKPEVLRIFSYFGFYDVPYHPSWNLLLNRPDVKPWWGAYKPAWISGFAIASFVGLIVSWIFLATLYTVPVWMLAFFVDKQLTLGGAWRLSGAALLPGALFFSLALFAYHHSLLNILQFLVAFCLHLLVPFIYILFSLRHLTAFASKKTPLDNPFSD